MSKKYRYPGGSLDKSLARLITYHHTQVSVGDQAWKNGTHFFLSSAFGGDIGTLSYLKVPDQNIIGVEKDQKAFELCRKRWPNIKIINSDCVDVLDYNNKEFNKAINISLDYCSPLPVVQKQVKHIFQGVPVGSVMTVWVLASREAIDQNSSSDKLHPIYWRKNSDKIYSKITGNGKYRWAAVNELLSNDNDFNAKPICMITYNSGSSPMLIASFKKILKNQIDNSYFLNLNITHEFAKEWERSLSEDQKRLLLCDSKYRAAGRLAHATLQAAKHNIIPPPIPKEKIISLRDLNGTKWGISTIVKNIECNNGKKFWYINNRTLQAR